MEEEYTLFWDTREEVDPYPTYRLFVDSFMEEGDLEEVEANYQIALEQLSEAIRIIESLEFETSEVVEINDLYVKSLQEYKNSVQLFEDSLQEAINDNSDDRIEAFREHTYNANVYQARLLNREIESGIRGEDHITPEMESFIDEYLE